MTPTHASLTPTQLADNALRDLLRSQWHGAPMVRLDSPPGAGKTGVVERLAVQSFARLGERVMLAPQTNQQAFDLARRIAVNWPRIPVHLFHRKQLPIPAALSRLPNVTLVDTANGLPEGPCIVVANATKWAWLKGPAAPYDLLVVDEAFQLPDYRFHAIAGLARRIVLVGDPGQIAPVVRSEIERWRSDPAGPHVACPTAVTHRHPGVLRLQLPVSRRLRQDTVRFVQPAFYPALPFRSISPPGSRTLTAASAASAPGDAIVDAICAGASLLGATLPDVMTGQDDPELSSYLSDLVIRLVERRCVVRDELGQRALTPERIGVVCAHVSQVSAVQDRLPAGYQDVLVETADRFQGLERDVMLVHHPLSGRSDVSDFHLDAGRLCVMLSRHRIGCVLVGRAGIERRLLHQVAGGDRPLNVDTDATFEGWRAHVSLLASLRAEGRSLCADLTTV